MNAIVADFGWIAGTLGLGLGVLGALKGEFQPQLFLLAVLGAAVFCLASSET